MRFCPSCGNKLEESKTFCQHCGTKMEDSPPSRHRMKSSLPVLSRKMKILLMSIVAFLIICIGLYKVGEHYTDKDVLVAKFEKHLEQGDAKELAKLLESSDSSKKISDKHIKSLLNYVKDYPEEKEELLRQLKENVKEIGIPKASIEETDEVNDQLIKVEQQGKKYFLYDKYVFVLQAFPLLVDSNLDDVTYYIDGKKVASHETESGLLTLGNYLPGEYKVEGKHVTEFIDLSKELKVSHFQREDYADVSFEVDSITIGSNVDKGTITIDGNKTGITFSNGEDGVVGPVLVDGSMKAGIEVDAPFGKVESEDVVIDDNHHYIEATLTDKQKEEVLKSLAKHLTNFSLAISNRDPAILSENSSVSEATRSSMAYFLDPGTSYMGYIKDIQVDGDTFYLNESDGKWAVEVGVIETWKDGYNYEGNASSLTESTYQNLYMLTYNNGWNVESWNSYSDQSENLKTVDIDYAELKQQFDRSKAFQTAAPSTDSEPDSSNTETTVVASFVKTFVPTSVKAINFRDFSIVSSQIESSSTSYRNEFSDYIDYLAEKGITEDLLNVEVISIEKVGENTYTVETYEEYEIYYSDGSGKYKSFQSIYEVKVTAEGPRIGKLIKTDVLDSEEL